ncbi:MAG: hypothetical protein ACK5NN_00285 [Sphingomonadaceae bacterium]
MIEPVSCIKFFAGWAPALAVSVAVEPPRIGRWIVMVAGLPVPMVASVLAMVGVLAARPLARRREAGIGSVKFVLVSVIMMVAVELWVLETQPGWLLAFVMAIGVGFSGYSLIETMGDEMTGLVKSGFATLRARMSGLLGEKETDNDTE